MSKMVQASLAYARMGWKAFPLHGIVDGKCTCGKDCGRNAGKHPRTARGFKEATTDPKQLTKWFSKWPNSNIGIATGDGLVVVDVDGPEGASELKALVEAHGALPDTLVAATGGGLHIVFAERPGAPEVRSSARDHVHFRGVGGYVVAAPSRHRSGKTYQWIKKHPIAELPDWLRRFSQGYEIANKNRNENLDFLGDLPAHLSGQTKNISALAGEALKSVWSPAEQARLTSALSVIPADQHDSWVAVGMALKDLNWQTNEGDIGFDLWVKWSETCPEKFALGVCEARWNSFRRTGVSVGSIYHMANQHGWAGGAPAPLGSPLVGDPPTGMNGHTNGAHVLPAAFGGQQPIFFPDRHEDGKPKVTCANASVAIIHMRIDCRKDTFHDRMLVGGEPINQWAGELSDDVIQMIRKNIRYRYGFDPKVENTRDACTQLCLENQFDPVCDYLDSLIWDGKPRLDQWLARYMGANDTEFNRVIGRLVMIAAVRRAYEPGTKFDQIVVLESNEGFGKSTAIEILAGKENFSDQSILNKQEREQQEAMTGVWLYEIADLTGMKKTEVEHIKAFASRNSDRARPAYGRFRVDRPRRTIFFATTNDEEYLKSQTGNRRFWPVGVGRIDLAALRADRDQLWAEAVHYEARGDSIQLPEKLWGTASEEQERRMQSDEWVEPIADYINLKNPADLSVNDVLCDNQFMQRKIDHVTISDAIRAGHILKKLGYVRYKKRIGGATANRWRKPDQL